MHDNLILWGGSRVSEIKLHINTIDSLYFPHVPAVRGPQRRKGNKGGGGPDSQGPVAYNSDIRSLNI